jgi:methylglutaconyl-CoA hydratase
MPYSTLQFELAGDAALITLNRPEKRNAISPEMIQELEAVLDQAESGPCRAAIITGAGKAFCTGMDLAVLRSMAASSVENAVPAASGAQEALVEDARLIAHFFRRLYTFPKPLVAAVNGPALAGGCGIATLCDFTLASPNARFGYTEVRVGFMPALVAVFLIRQIGEKRARDLLLSGRILDAEEARQAGLVNEVIGEAGLLDRARELTRELAEFSPTSLTCTKRLINELSRAELERQLEISILASAQIRSTADFREGLSAFLEKRKPRWQSP